MSNFINKLLDIILPIKGDLLLESFIKRDEIDYLYTIITHNNIDLILKTLDHNLDDICVITDELIIELFNPKLRLRGVKRLAKKINENSSNNIINTIICPLTLIDHENVAHFNFIIFDTIKKYIYRYEPHGKILKKYDNYQHKIDSLLTEFFLLSCRIPNLRNYKYLKLEETNPLLGSQEYIIKKNNNKNYLEGCCAYWGLCYLILNIIPFSDLENKLQSLSFSDHLDTFKFQTSDKKDIYFSIYQNQIYSAMITSMYKMFDWLQNIWMQTNTFTFDRIIDPFSCNETKLQIKTLEKFITKFDFKINQYNEGLTSLHLSVKQGLLNFTKKLIEYGGDINLKAKINKESLLHIAIKFKKYNEGEHHQLIEFLINQDMDVNIKDGFNLTPLFLAMAKNDKDVIDLLISKGADVNSITSNGKNLLHYICSAPLYFKLSDINWGFFEMLIEKGINLNDLDYFNRNPLHIACENLKYQDALNLFELCNKYNIEIHDDVDLNGRRPIDSIPDESRIQELIDQYILHKDFLFENKVINTLKKSDSTEDLHSKINKYFHDQKNLLERVLI